ncbi:MAG: ribosome maturation factor RimP [Candidatus Omnitrophica bacterium]|nr:ribosome maturation factor RimP [Candidatus Omnitrophota bacterium]
MEILAPIAEKKDAFVVDVAYKREGSAMVLRILMDKKNGVSIDECADINNELSQVLDEQVVINDFYILEISSPGLDRVLKKPKDFKWAMGRRIKATTYAPIEGNNVFRGTLVGIGEKSIVVETKEGVSSEIPLDKIAKAKLDSELK